MAGLDADTVMLAAEACNLNVNAFVKQAALEAAHRALDNVEAVTRTEAWERIAAEGIGQSTLALRVQVLEDRVSVLEKNDQVLREAVNDLHGMVSNG